jgi:peptidoglycan/LPS O-acetylase OafA/YrhL
MSNQKPISKKRLDWIDQSKGLAILGIIIFHFFQNYPERIDLVNILDRNGAKWGYAAVDIFFVIAGFNTSYSLASLIKSGKISSLKINWIEWLKKRIIRLYPNYWLAIILSIILLAVGSQINIKSFQDLIFMGIGVPGYQRFKTLNPGFWFFSVILQAYLITPIIFSICKGKAKNILVLGIVIGTIWKMVCLANTADSYFFIFLLQSNLITSYIFPLCLGMYWGFIYCEYQKFRRIDWEVSIATFAIGIVVYGFLVLSQIDFEYMIGFDMLFTPLFLLLFYWACETYINPKLTFKDFNLFSLMGVYSYQIYLIHQPLLFVALPILGGKIALTSYPRLTLAIIAIAILITVYVFIFIQLDNYLGKLMGKITKKSA